MKKTNVSTVNDLLLDESFMSWYLKENEEGVENWDLWIEESEDNRALAVRAVLFMDYLHASYKPVVTDKELESCWKGILQKITLPKEKASLK